MKKAVGSDPSKVEVRLPQQQMIPDVTKSKDAGQIRRISAIRVAFSAWLAAAAALPSDRHAVGLKRLSPGHTALISGIRMLTATHAHRPSYALRVAFIA